MARHGENIRKRADGLIYNAADAFLQAFGKSHLR